MNPLEKWLVQLDEAPLSCLYRMLVGFVLLPVYNRLFPNDRSHWMLLLFLVGVLISLRMIPMVTRRMMPVSPAARELWRKRRLLAKRYDSYQWSKLFWIGLGLLSYMLVAGELQGPQWPLALACLIGGGLGAIFWRKVRRTLEASMAEVQKSKLPAKS